jgi:hypothetical protein
MERVFVGISSMTMHFRDLADKVAVDGTVSIDEVLGLRASGWRDGHIDEQEIAALFDLNDHLQHRLPEWVDFFVEAVSDYLVGNGSPKGYVRDTDADALIERISIDGQVESMAELLLIERLFNKAIAVPEQLKSFALAQIENVVLNGTGPTRDGRSLVTGQINAEECRLLRAFIFASGGDRPAAVSKAEAEMLFRIKDASLAGENAPEWKPLFVQGVGNYLQGFSCPDQLSAERAAELESFMADTAVNIGGFFARMADAGPAGATEAMRTEMAEDGDYLEFDAQAAADAEVSDEEQAFLDRMLNSDGQIDELEKALLSFIAEV